MKFGLLAAKILLCILLRIELARIKNLSQHINKGRICIWSLVHAGEVVVLAPDNTVGFIVH